MVSLDLFFILFFLLPSISSSIHIIQLPSDAQALLDFKSKADLHNLLSFNESTSHCIWPGVQCDSPDHHRVVRFVVEGVPLGGVIRPDSLTRLDQLRVLSLQNNSLSGPIPDLSGLLNLKSLFLRHNSFSGEFPPSISSLHRLRTIDLSYNNLTGPIPASLSLLERIASLRIEFNRLNGSIPALNQSSLVTFNVSGNNLSGAVPITSVLVKFGSSSYALNAGLCGEIVHRECRLKLHGPSTVANPPKDGVDSDSSEDGRNKRRRHSAIAILGISIGVSVLIAFAAIGVTQRMRQQREKGRSSKAVMEVGGAAEAVAEVMRTEEEREEKVKTVEEGIKAAKSGSLVFFAGEAQPYTVEQLMRASAGLLGRGTVGTTYKAELDKSWMVCVKRLDAGKVAGAGREVFARHMESVGGLSHPNLVPLRAYFYFQDKQESLLVYDFQPNGSLFSLIHGSKSARATPLHWTSCLKIAEDVAQGLSYLHQAWRHPHGNLKSSNVLLGSDFEARLTDYCLTMLADYDNPDSCEYLAPEIHGSILLEATQKSDVYAFGVLLLELLTGKPPSQHPYLAPRDMVRWMRNTRGVVEEGGEEERRLEMLLEVGLVCRVNAQEKRPTMWQVLRMLQEIKEAVLFEADSDHSG